MAVRHRASDLPAHPQVACLLLTLVTTIVIQYAWPRLIERIRDDCWIGPPKNISTSAMATLRIMAPPGYVRLRRLPEETTFLQPLTCAAPADSSRRQIDSPCSPKANKPSVAAFGAGADRVASGPVLLSSSDPFVCPAMMGLLGIVRKHSRSGSHIRLLTDS